MTHKIPGLRVLNTRPLQQNTLLNQSIIEAGGYAISCPALDIKPTNPTWLLALPNGNDIDHAIFISANAVHFFYTELAQQNILWPKTIHTIAIGKGTANALSQWGVTAPTVPDIADSEHVLQLDKLHHLQQKTCVVIKGLGGLTTIEDTLQQRGANVVSLSVYQRTLPAVSPKKIKRLWQDDLVDIILITSEQALYNLFTLFGAEARSCLCKKPYLVLSKRLANAALRLGIQTIMVSSYDTVLDALETYYKLLNKGLTHDPP